MLLKKCGRNRNFLIFDKGLNELGKIFAYHPDNLQSSNNFSGNQTNFSNNQTMSREQTIDMLHRARNIFNQEIDKLK